MKPIFIFAFLLPAVQILFAQPEFISPGAGCDFSISYYDIFRYTSPGRKTLANGLSGNISAFITSGKGKFSLNAAKTELLFKTRKDADTLEMNILSRLNRIEAVYSGAAGPVTYSAGINLSGNGMSLRLSPLLKASLNFRNSPLKSVSFGIDNDLLPLNLDANYLGGGFGLSHHFNGQSAYFSFCLIPHKEITLEIANRYSIGTPWQDKSSYSAKDISRFKGWHLAAAYSKQESRLAVYYDYLNIKTSVDFKKDGLDFGYFITPGIHYQKISLEYHSPSAAYISIAAYRAEGIMEGTVESWPFLRLWESVIMNRLNFSIKSRIDLLTAKADKRYEAGGFSFTPSIGFYYLKPEFNLRTWQPKYLIFGISKLSENQLDITRAYLSSLGISIGWRTGSYLVSFQAGQFIPLYIKRPSRAPVQVTEPQRKSSSASDGLRSATFTISRTF